jgi:cell division protein FtsW (lipid II flippase)
MTRWRMVFALVGFIIALLSVALNDRRLVWVAIILLAISLLLRLIVRRRESPR